MTLGLKGEGYAGHVGTWAFASLGKLATKMSGSPRAKSLTPTEIHTNLRSPITRPSKTAGLLEGSECNS